MFTKRVTLVSIIRVSTCAISIALALILLSIWPTSGKREANTYIVTNTNDSGAGSLRQALIDANNSPSLASIGFDIPTSDPGYGLNTSGVWTIRPLTTLPALTGGAITIDGATQKTNRGDTNPDGPEVEIDGVHLGSTAAVFYIESGANTIQELAINGAGFGVQIIGSSLYSASNNYVINNYIGIDAAGTVARPNVTGVDIHGGASYNFVTGNLIAGNTLDGVFVAGSGSDNNRIDKNTFGINRSYDAALPNGRHSIYITTGPSKTVIGGDNGHGKNYIRASGMNGVYILNSHETTVSYNSIGAWDASPGKNGIAIEGGSSATNVTNNDIWWCKWHGIWISDKGTTVAINQNSIGSNALHGIAIYNGVEQSQVTGNSIWYSGWSGVALVNSNQNTLKDNDIGAIRQLPGDQRGNEYYGVSVVGGSNNTIGPGNIIAHNGLNTTSDGIRIDGAAALYNHITQNAIYSNGGKGIENINGGNAELLLPTITQANCSAIQGSAGSGFTVEVFSDASDEGRYYEGSTIANAITPAFSWSGPFQGPNVTATATDSYGNTSEFASPRTGACIMLYLPLTLKH